MASGGKPSRHNIVFTANPADNHDDAKDLAAYELQSLLSYSELPRIDWETEQDGFSCIQDEYLIQIHADYQEPVSHTVPVPGCFDS